MFGIKKMGKHMSNFNTNEINEKKSEIVITPKAAKKILEIKSQNNIAEDAALRIGVKGGGCSGLTYILDFDKEQKPYDVVFYSEGIKIFIDPKSLFHLSGTTLDFSDGLNGRGFVFHNPNAKRTCGCGESFAI